MTGNQVKRTAQTVSNVKLQSGPNASVGAKRTEHLLGLENTSSNAHNTRFWYLLEVLSKSSREHPVLVIREFPPGSCAHEL